MVERPSFTSTGLRTPGHRLRQNSCTTALAERFAAHRRPPCCLNRLERTACIGRLLHRPISIKSNAGAVGHCSIRSFRRHVVTTGVPKAAVGLSPHQSALCRVPRAASRHEQMGPISPEPLQKPWLRGRATGTCSCGRARRDRPRSPRRGGSVRGVVGY